MQQVQFILSAMVSLCVVPQVSALTSPQVRTIAENAYIYGYPLVLMDLTRELMVGDNSARRDVPLNTFLHITRTPTYRFTEVVRPNVDTLYSTAWLDLAEQPLVLSVPDTAGRFYVLPLQDMYTNVFAMIGSPTTGTHAGNFLIAGPQWQGEVPEGMQLVRAPYNSVWIIGRTQVNGQNDLKAVRALQKHYRLTPLATWNAEGISAPQSLKYHPSGIKPMEQIEHLTAQDFFTRLMRVLSENPPSAADNVLAEQMQSIGLEAGQDFAFNALQPDTQKILATAARRALKRIHAASMAGKNCAGWRRINTGDFGTSYLRRAVVAHMVFGALPSRVALYPTTTTDSHGNTLTGNAQYRVHFNAGQLPPADAFWSLTLYDNQGFLVKNDVNRYALGGRDTVKWNPDGSLDIYVQYQSPKAEWQSNWLPAPRGAFALTLRLYMPRPVAIQGIWRPPQVQQLKHSHKK